MKKYIVGAVVILVVGIALVLGLKAFAPAPVPETVPVQAQLGDVNYNSTNNFSTAVCHDNVCEDWEGGKIAAKSNQAYWKNTTGQTQYVDLIDVSTNGTASSTFNIYAIATSSALVPLYDFTTPAATSSNLINNFSFATSSTATTTSNLDKAFAGKVVQVLDGSQVNIYVRASDGVCNPQATKCETATSTNRGFDLFWRLHYHN